MATIGSFGDVVFEVSDKKVLTVSGLAKNVSASWEEHRILGQKAKREFINANLSDLNFRIVLKADFGVNPLEQIKKLEKMCEEGKTAPFLLGEKPLSIHEWSLDSISETFNVIDNKGNILSAEVDIKITEYVKKKATEKKTTSNVKTTKKSTTSSLKKIGTMTINVKSVHIRSGPGANNKVLGYAMKGDKLTVYGVKNGWYSLGGGKYITASDLYSSLKKG